MNKLTEKILNFYKAKVKSLEIRINNLTNEIGTLNEKANKCLLDEKESLTKELDDIKITLALVQTTGTIKIQIKDNEKEKVNSYIDSIIKNECK